jgi:hypothetical protein
MELEARAADWIAGYRDARHLVRTRDWLLTLEPDAGPALRLAALTHDAERMIPGGPTVDPARTEPDDAAYLTAHANRSADVVATWLTRQHAAPALVEEVAELIRRHEVGGGHAADLVQAADSLSFLETKQALMLGWLADGRCDLARARRQPQWMFDRITGARARALARPLLEQTLATLEPAAGQAGTSRGSVVARGRVARSPRCARAGVPD